MTVSRPEGHPTDEQLNALKAICDAATPGPWYRLSGAPTNVWTEAEQGQLVASRLSHALEPRDAAFIEAFDPVAVRGLCDALLGERAAHTATKAALAFYADERNWDTTQFTGDAVIPTVVAYEDGGRRARAALSGEFGESSE